MKKLDNREILDLWETWPEPFYAIGLTKEGYTVSKSFVQHCKCLFRHIEKGTIKIVNKQV